VTRPRGRLASLATVLGNADVEPAALARAAQDYYDLLSELTGVSDRTGSEDLGRPMRLATGEALAPRDAARSVTDARRTARILQGLEAAVTEAARRFPPPLEVLYAGCGPFAPFCFLLAARHGPDVVRFTLLDVQPASLAAAAGAIEALDLGRSVRAIVEADATMHRCDPSPHVIVCEALERALGREPQVAITLNLAPQLAPGGFLVPERILVEACLADPERELGRACTPAERPRIVLGAVLDLTAETARRFATGIPAVTFRVPALGPGDPAELMLRTTIGVFGTLTIGECESGVTYPMFRHELGRLTEGSLIEVRYTVGPRPGFVCTRA
jgi:hypothetical protein